MENNKINRFEKFTIDFGKILLRHHQESVQALDSKDDLDQNAQDFARYLRTARVSAALTPPELAEKADIPEVHVYALERGLIDSKQIEIAHLQRLAKVLDEDIETFGLILERDIPVSNMVSIPWIPSLFSAIGNYLKSPADIVCLLSSAKIVEVEKTLVSLLYEEVTSSLGFVQDDPLTDASVKAQNYSNTMKALYQPVSPFPSQFSLASRVVQDDPEPNLFMNIPDYSYTMKWLCSPNLPQPSQPPWRFPAKPLSRPKMARRQPKAPFVKISKMPIGEPHYLSNNCYEFINKM